MTGYYRFAFGGTANSDLTVTYSTDGSTFAAYNEPAWPPNPSNRGSVLQVSTNDTVTLQLAGPTGWQMSGQLQVIVARANSAASGQKYSPFSGSSVWMNPPGSMSNDIWSANLGSITDNPGGGKTNKYEITIAFNASLPGIGGPTYFSEDPELDVSGM